jgi:hypothetical protein
MTPSSVPKAPRIIPSSVVISSDTRNRALRTRSPNATLSWLRGRLYHLPSLRSWALLLRCGLSTSSAAAAATVGQSPLSAHGRRPVDAPHTSAQLSAASVPRACDGSWFPPDRAAVLSQDQRAWLLCHLWWPEPVDRPISPYSAAAKA